MGIENDIEPERLRRLCDTQPRALRRCFDISGFANQLDGVGDSDGGNSRAGTAGRFDRARDHRGRDEGRAASWIRTMSGFWLASASSPA